MKEVDLVESQYIPYLKETATMQLLSNVTLQVYESNVASSFNFERES